MKDFVSGAFVGFMLAVLAVCFAGGLGLLCEDCDQKPTDSRCQETVARDTFADVVAIITYRDCHLAGTIDISCNKPLFSQKANARIIASDNVIGLNGSGYPYTFEEEAGMRVCKVKWHNDRTEVTKTIRQILSGN